jgi:hypothetical protein
MQEGHSEISQGGFSFQISIVINLIVQDDTTADGIADLKPALPRASVISSVFQASSPFRLSS